MPSLKKYLVNYFTLTDDLLPQEEAESAIREGVSFKGTNMLILILAIQSIIHISEPTRLLSS